MIQSKELTQFYREYKAWLDNGAPDFFPFARFKGLCDNLNHSVSLGDSLLSISKVKNELADWFEYHHLDYKYPFGKENFEDRMMEDTQHLDPLRIKWVEDHLKPEFTGEK